MIDIELALVSAPARFACRPALCSHPLALAYRLCHVDIVCKPKRRKKHLVPTKKCPAPVDGLSVAPFRPSATLLISSQRGISFLLSLHPTPSPPSFSKMTPRLPDDLPSYSPLHEKHDPEAGLAAPAQPSSTSSRTKWLVGLGLASILALDAGSKFGPGLVQGGLKKMGCHHSHDDSGYLEGASGQPGSQLLLPTLSDLACGFPLQV